MRIVGGDLQWTYLQCRRKGGLPACLALQRTRSSLASNALVTSSAMVKWLVTGSFLHWWSLCCGLFDGSVNKCGRLMPLNLCGDLILKGEKAGRLHVPETSAVVQKFFSCGRKPQSLIDGTRELDLLSAYLSKFNVSGILSALFPSEWQPH